MPEEICFVVGFLLREGAYTSRCQMPEEMGVEKDYIGDGL